MTLGTVYVVIISALLVYGSTRWWRVRRRERAGQNWPFVEGVSEGGRAVVPSRGSPWAEIDYSYAVNGEYYAGRFVRGVFNNANEAQAYVDSMGKGRRLIVRYSPSDFEKSVVRDEDQQPLASS